jgi:hypothetical protein
MSHFVDTPDHHRSRRSRRRHAMVVLAGLTVAALVAGSAAAAAPGDRLRAAGERASLATGAPLVLRAKRGSDVASFVRRADGGDLLPSARRRPAADKAAEFLARHGDLFGLRDATAELRHAGSVVDALGWSHESWVQTHEGVEIFGATLRAHVAPDGALRVVNGASVPVPATLSTTPSASRLRSRSGSRSPARAARRPRCCRTAWSSIRPASYAAPTASLVSRTRSRSRWNASGRRDLVLIDALDGRVLDRLSLTPDALSRQVSQTSAVASSGARAARPDPGRLVGRHRSAGRRMAGRNRRRARGVQT